MIKKLSQIILQQFEPDIAVQLLEFGKSLSAINADILVFMARKSLCLYDVLVRLGIPPVQQVMISDRVLDMRLDHFFRKSVALIDDTLIVGTTLAKAKRLLEEQCKANISVHVFCANKKWWIEKLIRPDNITILLDDRRVMTFCNAEVRAFSLLPRPYLVDFPSSNPIHIRSSDLQSVLSFVEWSCHKISSNLQERNGVGVYTFFPSEDVISEFENNFGRLFKKCLNIVKLRAFTRKHEGIYSMQLVPIVTLMPMDSKELSNLLHTLLEEISEFSGKDLTKVFNYAESPVAQQRVVQYILSSGIGGRFAEALNISLGSSIDISFDEEETDRHFGPWLHDEMATISSMTFPAIWSIKESATFTQREFSPAELPKEVSEKSYECLQSLDASRNAVGNSIKLPPIATYNFFNDFVEIFLCLFNSREIPARREAKKLGVRLFDSEPEETPNRDRLEIGLPWSTILEFFSGFYGLGKSSETANLISLILDLCNDLGIAVPVTCLREGVVFRAYRHGEDVRFSDGELALAYEAVKGLLKASNRKSAPHLVVEKLLVLLMKIGAAKRFLEPLYGPSGGEGTVRIGFYLKGAVPILSLGPKDRADRDIWLSKYLLNRKVLKLDKKSQYALGKRVEGNFLVPDAPDQAFELGSIVGMLLKSAKDPQRQNAPLDDAALTLLATCWHPRHAAEALQVELYLFGQWYKDTGRAALEKINWKDMGSLNECYKDLIHSVGYEAVHAANLKFTGYRSNRNNVTVKECETFLKESMPTDLLGRKWRSYWTARDSLEEVKEKETFNPYIDRAGALCWELASCLMAIEYALSTKMALPLQRNRQSHIDAVIKKLVEYNKRMEYSGLHKEAFVVKLEERLRELQVAGDPDFDSSQIISFALKRIDPRIPLIEKLVEEMNPVIEEYGRLQGRHEYQYLVWYDIIDSTGTLAGREGQDLEIYRKRVDLYKDFVNNNLRRFSIAAKKRRCEIYCWNGDLSSKNDMKHIFIGGKFARREVENVLTMLIQGIKPFNDVSVRVYVIPCSFVGTKAYRHDVSTEVCGERFWEHWSRLLKKGEELERKCGKGYSFLLVATERLIKDLKIHENLKWITPIEDYLSTEIESLSRKTKVRYGRVQAK